MPELSFLRTCAALGAVGLALAATGCGKPLTEEDCLRLLDRYTELLAREEDPAATPELVERLKDGARTLARTDPRFELPMCSARVSRRGFDCAMTAPTVDAVERCLIF